MMQLSVLNTTPGLTQMHHSRPACTDVIATEHGRFGGQLRDVLPDQRFDSHLDLSPCKFLLTCNWQEASRMQDTITILQPTLERRRKSLPLHVQSNMRSHMISKQAIWAISNMMSDRGRSLPVMPLSLFQASIKYQHLACCTTKEICNSTAMTSVHELCS